MKNKILLCSIIGIVILFFISVVMVKNVEIEGLKTEISILNNELEVCNSEISEIEETRDVFVESYNQLIEDYREVCEGKIKYFNSNSGMRSWEDYRPLANSGSEGHRNIQNMAYTDENGLRKVEDCYCVAIGSCFNNAIGTKYLVTTDTGRQWKIIVGDQKSDKHTDGTNTYTSNGCMMEFIVDTRKLNGSAKLLGSVECLGFDGIIVEMEEL